MKYLIIAFVVIAMLVGCSSHGNAQFAPRVTLLQNLAQSQTAKGQSNGEEAIHFIVGVPLRNEAELDQLLAAISDPRSPLFRHFLSHGDFAKRFSPEPFRLSALASTFQSAGMTATIESEGLSVWGSRSQVSQYFSTTFKRTADGAFRPTTPLRIPPAVGDQGGTVVGINGERIMERYAQIRPAELSPRNSLSGLGPYYPSDLKQAYLMPSFEAAAGHGVTIGIVIDSPVSSNDIKDFFASKYFGAPKPLVSIKNVDGGAPYGGSGTSEATLDVEQAGGIAPRSRIKIYNVPSLGLQYIYDAYSAAIQDGSVSLVNSSFGGCEEAFAGATGKKILKTFDSLFKEGIALGLTFVASSGDSGSDACGTSHNAIGVNWPAVSPYVLAVGGSSLITEHMKGARTSVYVRESAEHDTNADGSFFGSGGGYSTIYARPSWQIGFVSNSGRGVPDVAGQMGGLGYSSGVRSGEGCVAATCSVDDSSDMLLVYGKLYAAAGTSASAPDTVGLLALATELQHSKLGDVHPLLYGLAKTRGLFHTGIPGSNGSYKSTTSLWDPILGLGTPAQAYKIVGATTAAGVPGSASNP